MGVPSLSQDQWGLLIGGLALVATVVGIIIGLRPRPCLKVTPLTNDPNVPLGVTNSVTGPDTPNDVSVVITPAGNSPTMHISQFYDLRWKTAGESFYALNRPRLQLKFGVVRVSNLPRSIKRLRFREGLATHVKVDVAVCELEHDGKSIPIPNRRWSNPAELSWYRSDWDSRFTMTHPPPDDAKAVITDATRYMSNPIAIIRELLTNPVLEELPVARDGFIRVFLGSSSAPWVAWTTSGYQLWIPGRYLLRIGVHSEQLRLTEYLLELTLRSWTDFDLRLAQEDTSGIEG